MPRGKRIDRRQGHNVQPLRIAIKVTKHIFNPEDQLEEEREEGPCYDMSTSVPESLRPTEGWPDMRERETRPPIPNGHTSTCLSTSWARRLAQSLGR